MSIAMFFGGILVFSVQVVAVFAADRLPSDTKIEENLAIQRLNGDLTTDPCFRASVRLSSGAMLSSRDLSGISIRVDGRPASPFWQQLKSFTDQGRSRTRISLILIDISGSMDERRFRGAQAAARLYAQDLDPDVDAVAIAPFASSRVRERIRAASFNRTRGDAEAAIASLTPPLRSNNTALYSAIEEGVSLLEEAGRMNNPRPQLQLVVLTDGINDVGHRGDDPGLLAGSVGLEAVSQRVHDSDVDTILIGLADHRPGSVNADELRKISKSHSPLIVMDVSELGSAFQLSRVLATASFEVSFVVPSAGDSAFKKDLPVEISLMTSGGPVLTTGVWHAPTIGIAPSGEVLTEQERDALGSFLRKGSLLEPQTQEFLRPLFVFVGFSLILVLLWFVVPRIIWHRRPSSTAWAGVYQIAEGWKPRRRRDGAGSQYAVSQSGQKREDDETL